MAEGRLVILDIRVGKCFGAAVSRTLPFLIQKCIFRGCQNVSHLSQDSRLKFILQLALSLEKNPLKSCGLGMETW